MKKHFIRGLFKTKVPTSHHEICEAAVLNIDVVFIVIVRSSSVFAECNKYGFKQNKTLLARNFISVYKPEIKTTRIERKKNNQRGFQKFKTPSCIN